MRGASLAVAGDAASGVLGVLASFVLPPSAAAGMLDGPAFGGAGTPASMASTGCAGAPPLPPLAAAGAVRDGGLAAAVPAIAGGVALALVPPEAPDCAAAGACAGCEPRQPSAALAAQKQHETTTHEPFAMARALAIEGRTDKSPFGLDGPALHCPPS
jgi:hypothetical protein